MIEPLQDHNQQQTNLDISNDRPAPLNQFLENMDLRMSVNDSANPIYKYPIEVNPNETKVVVEGLHPSVEQRTCKICLEDYEEPNNKLHTPCRCQGSVGWIHQECLKTWIVSQRYDLFDEIKCELCHEEYAMEISVIKRCSFKFNNNPSQSITLILIILFFIVNGAGIIYLIVSNIILGDGSSLDYTAFSLVIMVLFELILFILLKHLIQQMCFKYFVHSWKVLDYEIEALAESPIQSQPIRIQQPANANEHRQTPVSNSVEPQQQIGVLNRVATEARIIRTQSKTQEHQNGGNLTPSGQSHKNKLIRSSQIHSSQSEQRSKTPIVPMKQIRALQSSNSSYQRKHLDEEVGKKTNKYATIEIDNYQWDPSQKGLQQQNLVLQSPVGEEENYLFQLVKNKSSLCQNLANVYSKIDPQFIASPKGEDKSLTVLLSLQGDKNRASQQSQYSSKINTKQVLPATFLNPSQNASAGQKLKINPQEFEDQIPKQLLLPRLPHQISNLNSTSNLRGSSHIQFQSPKQVLLPSSSVNGTLPHPTHLDQGKDPQQLGNS